MSQASRGKILIMPVMHRETVENARAQPARNERKARWFLIASIVGALGLFWAGATLSRREETAGIRTLPAAERQRLYTRTVDELSTICRSDAAAAGALRDHCIAQAHFVMDLPECGDACQRAVAAVLPHARR